MTDDKTLETLTRALITTLRRDAAALEADGAPDLAKLADQLDRLVACLVAAPGEATRRHLLAVLEAVETFHARVRAEHAATGSALRGAAQRRLASRAYGQAERYVGGAKA